MIIIGFQQKYNEFHATAGVLQGEITKSTRDMKFRSDVITRIESLRADFVILSAMPDMDRSLLRKAHSDYCLVLSAANCIDDCLILPRPALSVDPQVNTVAEALIAAPQEARDAILPAAKSEEWSYWDYLAWIAQKVTDAYEYVCQSFSQLTPAQQQEVLKIVAVQIQTEEKKS